MCTHTDRPLMSTPQQILMGASSPSSAGSPINSPRMSALQPALADYNLFQIGSDAPADASDGAWVMAYMAARDLAEENEFQLTGVRPQMYEPKIPHVKKPKKEKKKKDNRPKIILPPIDELTEQRFYEMPTKMIPMDQNREEHLDLNRYRNILPYNRSWVQLSDRTGVTKDKSLLSNFQYVNANYIPNFDGSNPQCYIASQGPKPNGLPQFWRMIWQENVRSIAMLTGLVEKGRNKCAQYWPAKEGDVLDVSGMQIKTIFVGRKDNAYLTTEIEITAGTEKRHLTHLWFDLWPDLGVPSWKEGLHLQPLLNDANRVGDADAKRRNAKKAPIVVHCSAGIGRTGVLIALDHAMDSLDRHGNRTFNLIQTVDKLRDHRGGMLQTWEQSTFLLKLIHKTFSDKAKAKAATDAEARKNDEQAPKGNSGAVARVQWHQDKSGVEITDDFV